VDDDLFETHFVFTVARSGPLTCWLTMIGVYVRRDVVGPEAAFGVGRRGQVIQFRRPIGRVCRDRLFVVPPGSPAGAVLRWRKATVCAPMSDGRVVMMLCVRGRPRIAAAVGNGGGGVCWTHGVGLLATGGEEEV
jgi:hypothetical protein